MPRHPNGQIDWMIFEGDLMIALMLAAILAIAVHAVFNNGH